MLEGKVLMLKDGVWAVPRDSAPVHQILVHPCVSYRQRGDSGRLLQLGPLVALLSCNLSPCLPHPGDRSVSNSQKLPCYATVLPVTSLSDHQ